MKSNLITFKPDPTTDAFDTGFSRFESSHGISGLARVQEERIDLLAVSASKPGKGQFKRFLKAMQSRYKEIGLWHVWNPRLERFLVRRGFSPAARIDEGEIIRIYEWKEKQVTTEENQ